MLNKFILTLTTAGAMLAFAAGSTYKVNILEDTTVAGKQVKAGDYKVQVENNTAVFKRGKETIEVSAHTEEAKSKYSGTQIQYVNNAIREIHVGGSTTKIVFTGNAGGPSEGTN